MLGFSPIGSAPTAVADAGVASGQVVGTTTGIGPVAALGTPFVYGSIVCSVDGVATTVLGVPVSAVPQTICVSASIAPSTALGVPSYLSAFVCTASGIARQTALGRPRYQSGYYASPSIGGVAVGAPRARVGRFVCTPDPIRSGVVGAPNWTGAVRCATVGEVRSASIGVPIGGFTHFCSPQGFCSTRFGQPYVPQAAFDLSIFVRKAAPRFDVRPQ